MKTTSLSAAIALAVFSTGAYAYTPGTYTAAIAGQNGPVKVEVTTSADKILSVKIVDQKETEGIGSKAVAALPAEIVKAQSANVQSIAGASVSSAAIRKAVQECLNQAQGKKAAPLALKNGTFEGKAYGNNGWLTVEVTIKDNKITDIKTALSGRFPALLLHWGQSHALCRFPYSAAQCQRSKCRRSC